MGDLIAKLNDFFSGRDLTATGPTGRAFMILVSGLMALAIARGWVEIPEGMPWWAISLAPGLMVYAFWILVPPRFARHRLFFRLRSRQSRFYALRRALEKDLELARNLHNAANPSRLQRKLLTANLWARVRIYLTDVGLEMPPLPQQGSASETAYWVFLLEGLVRCCEDRSYEAAKDFLDHAKVAAQEVGDHAAEPEPAEVPF